MAHSTWSNLVLSTKSIPKYACASTWYKLAPQESLHYAAARHPQMMIASTNVDGTLTMWSIAPHILRFRKALVDGIVTTRSRAKRRSSPATIVSPTAPVSNMPSSACSATGNFASCNHWKELRQVWGVEYTRDKGVGKDYHQEEKKPNSSVPLGRPFLLLLVHRHC